MIVPSSAKLLTNYYDGGFVNCSDRVLSNMGYVSYLQVS
jgi:hypothetical protein